MFAAYRLKDRKALAKGGQVILQKLLYRCQLSLHKLLSLWQLTSKIVSRSSFA